MSERKAVSLPPGPWKMEHGTDNWIRIFDSERLLVGRVPKDLPAVAALLLRAPAVEAAARGAEKALSRLWLAADRTRSKLISARLNPGYHEGLDETITQAREALKSLRTALGEEK